MTNSVIQRAESLTQQVHRYLRDEILAGTLEPGERLVESKIALTLQISRSPVREAIRQLIAEQLLEEKDGAVYVLTPTFDDLRELCELRIALETTMARAAAERIRDAELVELQRNLSDTQACIMKGELNKLPEINAQFHEVIWRAAGNQRILSTLSNVAALINYYCFLIFKINKLKTNMLNEHNAIYLSLKQRDGESAYQAMFVHLNRDLQIIEKAVQQMNAGNSDF